ncbi:MAG: hypothetical protein JSS81_22020 [Acidobacteria bacterium]|nr:hypothetical protein [Acidobacteriota bacterium]
MMKSALVKTVLAAILLTVPTVGSAQTADAVGPTRAVIRELIEKSFPELAGETIEVKPFESETDFFKSRFAIDRFLTFRRPHYVIFVNPEVYRRAAPADGVRAILAHELAHVLYYRRKNRFELLGLAALASPGFTAGFERRADLEAVVRGYGEGLKSYRRWLYENIPAAAVGAKMRDYFSPAELDAMLRVLGADPLKIDVWRRRVPRNLADISK